VEGYDVGSGIGLLNTVKNAGDTQETEQGGVARLLPCCGSMQWDAYEVWYLKADPQSTITGQALYRVNIGIPGALSAQKSGSSWDGYGSIVESCGGLDQLANFNPRQSDRRVLPNVNIFEVSAPSRWMLPKKKVFGTTQQRTSPVTVKLSVAYRAGSFVTYVTSIEMRGDQCLCPPCFVFLGGGPVYCPCPPSLMPVPTGIPIIP
jgi:hypothetical protein